MLKESQGNRERTPKRERDSEAQIGNGFLLAVLLPVDPCTSEEDDSSAKRSRNWKPAQIMTDRPAKNAQRSDCYASSTTFRLYVDLRSPYKHQSRESLR